MQNTKDMNYYNFADLAKLINPLINGGKQIFVSVDDVVSGGPFGCRVAASMALSPPAAVDLN